MSHIVYLVSWPNRIASNIEPFYYIGSKSNASFEDGILYDKYGKEYWGSGSFEGAETEFRVIEVLDSFDVYNDCLFKERDLHILNDVVASTNYFNKAIATISTYANPDYATVRHVRTGKCVRLLKDHPMILSGEYVNVNTGMATFNDGILERQFFEDDIPAGWKRGRLESHILSGEDNSFFGKKHTQESKDKLIETRNATYAADPDRYTEIRAEQAARASRTFKGVPKTEESNRKRSRKGFIMLKNLDTGECVRVKREDKVLYEGWVNPASASPHPGIGSKWSTNGVDNIKLKPNEMLSDGFRYGRTFAPKK